MAITLQAGWNEVTVDNVVYRVFAQETATGWRACNSEPAGPDTGGLLMARFMPAKAATVRKAIKYAGTKVR